MFPRARLQSYQEEKASFLKMEMERGVTQDKHHPALKDGLGAQTCHLGWGDMEGVECVSTWLASQPNPERREGKGIRAHPVDG